MKYSAKETFETSAKVAHLITAFAALWEAGKRIIESGGGFLRFVLWSIVYLGVYFSLALIIAIFLFVIGCAFLLALVVLGYLSNLVRRKTYGFRNSMRVAGIIVRRFSLIIGQYAALASVIALALGVLLSLIRAVYLIHVVEDWLFRSQHFTILFSVTFLLPWILWGLVPQPHRRASSTEARMLKALIDVDPHQPTYQDLVMDVDPHGPKLARISAVWMRVAGLVWAIWFALELVPSTFFAQFNRANVGQSDKRIYFSIGILSLTIFILAAYKWLRSRTHHST